MSAEAVFVVSAVVGTILAIGGLVFQAGRLSARVESLEVWRRDLTDDLKAIRAELVNIRDAVLARRG